MAAEAGILGRDCDSQSLGALRASTHSPSYWPIIHDSGIVV